MKLTVKEQLELDLEEQIENSYSFRPAVPGLDDVEAGYKPLYPVTVYQISGDDTSGVAGVLFPDGNFIEAQEQRHTARYWEFDETLRYEPYYYEAEGRWGAKGDSWDEGEVLWDGSSGPIMPLVELDAEIEMVSSSKTNRLHFVKKTVRAKVVVHRRLADTNTLIGESEALNRQLPPHSRMPGRLHLRHIMTNEGWSAPGKPSGVKGRLAA